jgi:hypothetical protein
MPKSCNSGFRSAPSSGASNMIRKNGLELFNNNSKKPRFTAPIIANTLLLNCCRQLLEPSSTANIQQLKIITHNNSEPSCAPHTAVNLKYSGKLELELLAIYRTEKSSSTNNKLKMP